MDNVTPQGIAKCARVMRVKGLYGEPVTHAKTYKAWYNAGMQVRKGQKAFHKSMTFIMKKDKKTGEEKKIARTYSLFHISQCDVIKY